jgi:zinc-finger of the FCS-type, C2-C2
MFLRSKIQQIMIRKRSRSIGNNKQSISTDRDKPSSPLLNYPRLILGLSPKVNKTSASNETKHVAISPTSTLEPIPFSKITNPTWAYPSPSTISRETKNNNPEPIGLGLIDALNDEEMDNNSSSCQDSRMVLFGSKLKIQVPPPSPTGHHIEFGIKNKSSQLALCSPIDRTPIGSNGCLSPRDLELLSEDYTCIISHGPNPRTTHIFDNRVVESPGTEGLMNMISLRCDSSDRYSNGGDQSGRQSGDFLSFCHGCNKDISSDSDVFMYRLIF